ncbi:TatD family hydrolase [Psychrobacter sp. AOP7-C1-14]|uniref:TatD family hydrolase n=1 Tax=Psychrobacter sp. AOP7-C1-14 TaxID=3457640 RepID=UPI003FB6CF98
MCGNESATIAEKKVVREILKNAYPLIDTHTHFDATVFDKDRRQQVEQAYRQGIRHLVLVGYLHQYFDRMYGTQDFINKISQSSAIEANNQDQQCIKTHIALGLHPFYIEQHTEEHLKQLEQMVVERRPLAIGEIGLDTFTDTMKQPDVFAKQERFFKAQLDMAVDSGLPVMLHTRKAHAEALAILKAHEYDAHKLGGIAHSFSGGEQEAKAFVKLGFKLGVTGQITNPNAKKLRRAIQVAVNSHGIECLVIETDCPDMTPIMCQTSDDTHAHNRNVPANLPWVLASLSKLLEIPHDKLAKQLWQNSRNALKVNWAYPV